MFIVHDNTGLLVPAPGREGFPEVTLKSDGLTELPAAQFAGFLWVSLYPGTPSTWRRTSGSLPTSSTRGASGGAIR